MAAQALKRDEIPDRFDTPAKVIPGHHRVVDTSLPERWWTYEVEDKTPLGLAYKRGQLASGRRGYTAEDRFGAGHIYRGIYDTVNGSDCGGSNMERVSGARQEARSSESLCTARDLQRKIKDQMAKDNFAIVDAFCGAGSHASEAVRARYAGFEKSVYPAICAALDDLIDAVIKLGLHKVSGR